MTENFDYDVALSFAGEDRAYVKKVAERLKDSGLDVFYDEYNEVELWGKDLYEHLHEVYAKKAKYCVIFISKAYATKVWPTHERRSAQERALRQNQEYILPARFDDTELPGLRATTSYIDLRNKAPGEFADMIVQKALKVSGNESREGSPDSVRVPRVPPADFNPYSEAQAFILRLKEEMERRDEVLRSAGASLAVFPRGERTCFRVTKGGEPVFSLDVWPGALTKDTGLSFYASRGRIRASQGAVNAWAEIVWSKDEQKPVLELHDMSLFGETLGGSVNMTLGDFVEKVWDRVVEAVERAQP